MSYNTFQQLQDHPELKALIQQRYDELKGICEYVFDDSASSANKTKSSKKRKYNTASNVKKTCKNKINLEKLLDFGDVWYHSPFEWGKFGPSSQLCLWCEECDSRNRQCSQKILVDKSYVRCICRRELSDLIRESKMSESDLALYKGMCSGCYKRTLSSARNKTIEQQITTFKHVSKSNTTVPDTIANPAPLPVGSFRPNFIGFSSNNNTNAKVNTNYKDIKEIKDVQVISNNNDDHGDDTQQQYYVHPAVNMLKCPIGYTHDYHDYASYLKSKEWSQLREFVLYKRANGICEESLPDDGCRCTRPADHAHHIDYYPFLKGLGYCDTPRNLVALCNHCHEVRHTCVNCKRVSTIRCNHIKLKVHLCDACVKQITSASAIEGAQGKK